jgi:predicted metal-dependent hydrolase
VQERHHNERFIRLLDQHLPQWRMLREELNGSMLADFQSEPVSSGTVA